MRILRDDDAAFARARSRVADLPLPAPIFSYLFPHDVRIVGPEKNDARTVMPGSGWTRNIPHGWTQQRAEEDFLAALAWCSDALKGSGVALEQIREHGAWLSRIHLADTGRLNPGTGSYDYPAFLGHLKAAAYGGRLSCECGTSGDPLDAMRASVAFLRRAWRDAQAAIPPTSARGA